MDEANLRATLTTLPPHSRDLLRRVLIGDQTERDAAAAALLRVIPPAGTSPTRSTC